MEDINLEEPWRETTTGDNFLLINDRDQDFCIQHNRQPDPSYSLMMPHPTFCILTSTNQISLALFNYMCKHIVGSEEEVKVKRLLSTVQYRVESCCHTCILSGSVGEGLVMKRSDLDIMFVEKNVQVFEDKTSIEFDPANTLYAVLVMEDTKGVFTKLRLIHTSPGAIVFSSTEVNGVTYISSSLYKLFYCEEQMNTVHGPCLSDIYGWHDFAYCLHSKSWISPANQWITRHRGMWPDVDIMSTIIDHGVLFVPVGCKGSPTEDIEWRISFSVGEKLLIYSFTHTQLLCYALMKILLKDVINRDKRCKDVICSYFIKTIMFWISEELLVSIWRPENLIPCFMQCVKRLIYCIKYSLCPHYFIEDNNLFENKIEGERRTHLLDKLNTIISLEWRCIFLSEQLQNFHVCGPFLFANMVENLLRQHIFLMSVKKINKDCVQLNNIRYVFQKVLPNITLLKSSRLKLIFLFWLSKNNLRNVNTLNLADKDGNKTLYKQYKTTLCYILQSLYNDAVSGWLMLATFFYKMKQYNIAIYVLSHALLKCSAEKLSQQYDALSKEKLLHLNCWEKMGVLRGFIKLSLDHLLFPKESFLRPEELKMEEDEHIMGVPPVAYAHFLCFLCHYHRKDVRQCYISLRDLELTATEQYFIPYLSDQALSYKFHGIALQLVEEYEAVNQAFRKEAIINDYLKREFPGPEGLFQILNRLYDITWLTPNNSRSSL